MGIKLGMKFDSRFKVFHSDVAEDSRLLRMVCHGDWQMFTDLLGEFRCLQFKGQIIQGEWIAGP
jgi:hypothetical protein